MRPTSVTVGSETASAAIPVNWRATNFRISVGVVLTGGASLTYTVQHTFDNVFDSLVTPVWFPHATLVDKIANADGAYVAPIIALRLNVTTYASGSATMTIISQGG